ncbi:MAG: 2,3-bisphosphoglycerate-independent phosphoglycerate mutase [Actinomycetota bacterium]|nr:2,3-bisphosphoglycerate-independent phosphoglycerate mutase [Actinomycetota bacterium]
MGEIFTDLVRGSASKILLVVLDGLGGFRTSERRSELHSAATPNLDRLAFEGSSGLQTLVSPGITPGSGAGHLALFGFDPTSFELGRGALSAAGIGFELEPGDVAARVNFCTLDEAGIIVDRRAGRISSDENRRLCKTVLDGIDTPSGVQLFLETERDHRALMVLRGEGLSPEISDTDPQVTGVPPLPPTAIDPAAATTANLLIEILQQAGALLKDEKANFILLRGFDTLRPVPSFSQRYKLDAMGIAGYPMYIGIARLLGMTVSQPQSTFADEVAVLTSSWKDHEFFYVHQKATDSAGEDGDFDRKVAAIEQVDREVERMMALQPDVICVTGDHSTPSQMRSHSWHPVPFLMRGPLVPVDDVDRFNEEDARLGGFGQVMGKDLMPLMLAAAGKLVKFGA